MDNSIGFFSDAENIIFLKTVAAKYLARFPVHALLGADELEDSLAEKDITANLTNFTHNLIFGKWQKHVLPKRQ